MAKPSARGSNTKPKPAKTTVKRPAVKGAGKGAKAGGSRRTGRGTDGTAGVGVGVGAGGRPAPDVTFREFQALIRARYYATDSARGVPGTFMWLIEEVGELATSLQDNAPGKTPTAEDRANLVEEFADVIAWLTTLANIANVDLAEALTKYTDVSRVKGVKS